ncbi:MAG: efflux RND transporter periplasmic adaptor subunit [Gammaproteobacteria bacterium]|nr:efflux RND transporter periplasmic adaptor subunit [Gammaproteobacteria bacterium]
MRVTLFADSLVRYLAVGVLMAVALPASAQNGETAPTRAVPVDARNVRATVTLGGTVVPYQEVTLAAQLPGRVVMLAGKEGDQFDKDAVLARLDDNELRAQHQAAMSALRDAEVAMQTAGIQYNRELIAPNRGSPGQFGGMGMPTMMDQMFTRPFGNMMGMGNPYVERGADLWQQGAQIEQARNSHLRAQAQLREIGAKFRDAQSVAPFDGVITNKLVEVGDTVQPGQPLLEFADTEYLQVRVEIPARLMPGIREGMVVRAKLDVGDRAVNARVAQIFPLADPERHTVRVKFDLPTAAPAAPGMYAEVMVPDVNAPVRQVLVIPVAALKQRGSLPMVEVARDEGRKELRIVRLGEYLDPYNVTVLSGLQPGDLVYVDSEQPGGGQTWAPAAPVRPAAPLRTPRY